MKETIEQLLFVIKQISYKEGKKKVDETNLGVIWHVLNPLVYMIVLATYYQNVVTHDIEKYPVFVFIGFVIMNYYRAGTIGAMDSLSSNKQLLIKTRLPIEVFVDVRVIMAIKELLYSLVAFIPILIFFKVPLSIRMLQFIPIMVLTTVIIVGIGKILSIIYLYFGDIDHLYRLLMTMMFYVSGVFIPLEHMPESLQTIFSYNPIFISIYLTRNSIMYNLPSHWTAWAKIIVWAVFFYGVGSYTFEKKRDVCMNRL